MTNQVYTVIGIPLGPPPDSSWTYDETTRAALLSAGPGGTVSLNLPTTEQTALENNNSIV